MLSGGLSGQKASPKQATYCKHRPGIQPDCKTIINRMSMLFQSFMWTLGSIGLYARSLCGEITKAI